MSRAREVRSLVRGFVLGVVLLTSCKQRDSAPSTTSSPDASTVPAPSGSTTSGVPSSADERERAVLSRWNDALNKGETGALRALYAASVLYYGTTLDGPSCVRRVAAALANAPGYHQEIEIKGVADDVPEPTRATLFFTKRNAGRTYDAYLVVDDVTSTILEESDRTTDANLVKRGVCFSYGSPVTLGGTLSRDAYPANDRTEDGEFLNLDKPVCVIDVAPAGGGIQDAEDFSGPVQPPRIDAPAVHLLLGDRSSKAIAAVKGKRVTVTGRFEGRAMRDFTNLHLAVDKIAAH
jgi:hypothetical protein